MQLATRQTMDSNIDPSTVIHFFESEEERLKKELESVQMAKETMRKFLNLKTEEIDEINHHYQDTHKETKSLSPISTFKARKFAVPTAYDKDDTYAKKILFILNREGEASTPELIRHVLKEEPELEPKKVAISVSKNATRLLADDKVILEKSGNTNVYRLK